MVESGLYGADNNINKNKFSKYMNNNIVNGYKDIDRVHSIEKEREEVMSTEAFQNWCKDMRIGSRVHKVDSRANELMGQYPNYTRWLSRR